MENVFEPILDKDEKVIKIFKPHKAKMFVSMSLTWFFCWIWILLISLLGLLTSFEESYNPAEWWLFVIVIASILIVCVGLTFLFFTLSYKKTYYAYTNKRVIIRKGIIGVDYKSLDLDMIGVVTVNVGVLDKIMRKNTGTISYGSMASPVGGQNGPMFRFAHIVDPYETYKEIKGVIDEYKNKKHA